MATKYVRGKTWWISYMENGERKRESLGTRNATVANELLRRKERELRLGIKKPKKEGTIADLIPDFMEWQEKRVSEEYAKTQRGQLDTFAEFLPTKMLPRDVTAREVVDFGDHLMEKGLSAATVQRYFAAVSRFFVWAIREDHAFQNPARDAEKPKAEKKAPVWLTKEERDKLIAAAKGTDLYLPVMLGAYAGLRASEILKLEWRDYDGENIKVRAEISKSKADRLIPVHPKLKAALKPHRKAAGSVCGLRKDREGVRVLGKEIKALANSCGIQKGKVKGAHILRHTFASHLVQAGVPIYDVKEYLGHSTIQMTEIYAHLQPGRREGILAIA